MKSGRARSAVIYGTGQLARTLLWELQQSSGAPYIVRDLIPEHIEAEPQSPESNSSLPDCLLQCFNDGPIEAVLIALDSASSSEVMRVLRACRDHGIKCRIVPPSYEIRSDRSLLAQLRDVATSDLVANDRLRWDEEACCAAVRGRSILVTGAGGSIGSELCRHIARLQPSSLIAFDRAESALFDLQLGLSAEFPSLPLFCEVGCIQNAGRVEELFQRHQPQCVIHAAAYKHVPLMETHPFEAVENNVIGTCCVAQAAHFYRAEDFILISTDKAASPCGVLGVTKRIAELMVLELNDGATNYKAVRFGNVIGSNGSVSRVFERQIAGGYPITITHPDAHRLFMSLGQASQFVLQALASSRSGEICAVRCAEGMLISELAERMLLAAGKLRGDVPVHFTGLRPGERLQESLFSEEEDRIVAEDEAFLYLVPARSSASLSHLSELVEICRSRNLQALGSVLQLVVPGYAPGPDLSSYSTEPGVCELP